MSQLLSSSATGAAYLIALQLLSRLLTFGLNQFLLRLTTPEAFGIASVQFELLLNTILFVSREGIRGAVLRRPPTADSDTEAKRRLNQICAIPLLPGIPLAVFASYLYARNAASTVRIQPAFGSAVALYALSAVLELLSEPFYLSGQIHLRFKQRIAIEGSAVIAKATTTLFVMLLQSSTAPLLAFAIGQLAYAVVLLLRYLYAERTAFVLPAARYARRSSGIPF